MADLQMPFFNGLDQPVKDKAFENLAFRFLEDFIQMNEDEDVERNLMEELAGESRPDLRKAYQDWEAQK